MLFFNTPPGKMPIVFLFLCFCFFPQQSFSAPQKTLFPLFPTIENNVKFWEHIYSTYTVNTAVIHDKNDLGKIYETLPLLKKNLPGANRANRFVLKRIKKNYANILRKLSLGKKPSTPIEKRVYSMFSPPRIRQQFKQASENIRVQTGLKEQFRDGVVRSGEYIDQIKKILKSYNLPEDLAYIPHVESSFNVKAYSKFGAAGIWQFTRSTGKNFMTIDYTIDERRDPLIATHAAAKYLKQSFEALGTWPLAITAYNYGHAGMQRAASQEGTYEKIFRNYKKGHFKFASRNFYSEFLAAKNIAKQLEKSSHVQLAKPRKHFSLKLKGYVPLNDIINHFKLDLLKIQSFNPSLRSPVLNGEKYIPKGFLLQLPHAPNTIQLAHHFPHTLLHAQQKRSKFYKVKRGDTAGKIARTHGVSLRSLSNANNLNKNLVVYIGQTLRIPPLSRKASNTTKVVAVAQTQNSKKPIPILSGSQKTSPSWKVADLKQVNAVHELAVISTSLNNGVRQGIVIVQPEESLAIYAEWLKISKKKLLQFNNMPEKVTIHPGQKIALTFSNTTQELFEGQRQDFHQETEQDFFSSYKITGFRKYKVAKGDTLWDICQNKFDMPLWLLKKYNSGLQYNRLESKQNLKIPIVEAL